MESRWFDDVCNIGRPLVPRPGPAPRSVPYPQFRMQFPDTCSSSLSEKPGISTITFQSMKCVWGNCMRICADRAPPPPTGTAAWSLYSLGASRGGSCVEFLGCSGACCYERRQSEEFFVWISAPLLRTSSIRGVFRVDFCPVVTNVVNPRAFSLKMAVFGLRLTTFVTGVLVR